MSEIRDRVKEKLDDILTRYGNWASGYDGDMDEIDIDEALDAILSIPEIAIVDRGAKLPKNPFRDCKHREAEGGASIRGCLYDEGCPLACAEYVVDETQQDMLKEGWGKEVKDV